MASRILAQVTVSLCGDGDRSQGGFTAHVC